MPGSLDDLFAGGDYQTPDQMQKQQPVRRAKAKSVDDILNRGGRSRVEGRERFTLAYILRQLEHGSDRPPADIINAVKALLPPRPSEVRDEQDRELRERVMARHRERITPLLLVVRSLMGGSTSTYAQSTLKQLVTLLADLGIDAPQDDA